MNRKEKVMCALRRYRRRWYQTPAERLELRYDKALFELIGDKERYYALYKLSPKQAKAKGLI